MVNNIEKKIKDLIITNRFEDARIHIKDNDVNVNTQYEGGVSMLHFASQYGANEIVKLLLDKGADIDIKDSCGNTPLMDAIYCYNWKDDSTIKLLISKGANVQEKNNYGVTVKELAKLKGYVLEEE